jgi:hypothetical protein
VGQKTQTNIVEHKEEEEFYVFMASDKGVIGNKTDCTLI